MTHPVWNLIPQSGVDVIYGGFNILRQLAGLQTEHTAHSSRVRKRGIAWNFCKVHPNFAKLTS